MRQPPGTRSAVVDRPAQRDHRLNAVADVMKTPTDFNPRLPGLVTSASAIVGQVAKLRNGKH